MDVASMLRIEDAEGYLRQCNAEGHSVIDHLSDVLSALLTDRPEDPYDSFELISESVKRQKDIESHIDTNVNTEGDHKLNAVKVQWTKTRRRALKYATIDDSDRVYPAMPDFLRENRLLNWAGFGFAEKEAFTINCSLKRLASEVAGLVSLRFWGKVLGVDHDYVIAEGQLEGEEDLSEKTEEGEHIDPRGMGANRFTYWALRETTGDWELLPDILPVHVRMARRIKKLFSGDLDRPVVTSPWFPGKERHLLRALIAQVSSETVICPAGLWRPKEEIPNQLEEDPEYEYPTTKELLALESWTHCREYINEAGLTSYPEVDEDADEELYAKMQEKMQQDPILEATRSIAEDPDMPDGHIQWSSKLAGDTGTYGPEGVSHGILVLRNFRWPGAVTVYQDKKLCSCYIGYGLRAGLTPFYPAGPGDIQEDPEDLEEQPEPQPEDDELSDGGSQEEEERNSDEDEEQA